MEFEISWEEPQGLYANFAGWVTADSASRLAHAITGDPRYDDLRYIIVDLTRSPGHTFRRDDRNGVASAMVQLIGAGFTNQKVTEIAIATDARMLNFLRSYATATPRPFHVFATIGDARAWLSAAGAAPRPGA